MNSEEQKAIELAADNCEVLRARLARYEDADGKPLQGVAVPDGWRSGVEAVAKLIEKKADDYALEYGHGDMGGLSFGSGSHAEAKSDYHSSLIELAAEVLDMIAPTPPSDHKAQDLDMVEPLPGTPDKSVVVLYCHDHGAFGESSGADDARQCPECMQAKEQAQ